MDTSKKTHAERELEILSEQMPDAIILPFAKEITALYETFAKEITALYERFSESGQSEGSDPFVAKALSNAIEKLLLKQIVAPLTGEDWEFVKVAELDNGKIMYQNSRAGRVFKDGKDGRAYFIDAIVFRNEFGDFTGNCIETTNGKIGSPQYIKSFPFYPKTFYIDVIKQYDENGKEVSERVADESQLEEVFAYYDKK